MKAKGRGGSVRVRRTNTLLVSFMGQEVDDGRKGRSQKGVVTGGTGVLALTRRAGTIFRVKVTRGQAAALVASRSMVGSVLASMYFVVNG